jgi:hypothetical protein
LLSLAMFPPTAACFCSRESPTKGRDPQDRSQASAWDRSWSVTSIESPASAIAGLGVDDLQGCAPAFGSATFHEVLEALRTMLAGEVDGARARASVR